MQGMVNVDVDELLVFIMELCRQGPTLGSRLHPTSFLSGYSLMLASPYILQSCNLGRFI